MYQRKPEGRHHGHHMLHDLHEKYRARRPAVSGAASSDGTARGRRATLAPPNERAFRRHSRSASRATRSTADGYGNSPDGRSEISQVYDEDSHDDEQDIDELWYVNIRSHNDAI